MIPTTIIFSIVFLLGLALLNRALRGRRIDDHPVCRKCGYDLSGREGRAARCPECGRDLAGARRAVRIGNRRRRPVVAACGALVALIALTIGGIYTYHESRGFDWNTIKPYWLLKREALDATGPNNGAIEELTRRIEGKALGSANSNDLLEAIIALRNDSESRWFLLWHGLAEALYRSGQVDNAVFSRYLRDNLGMSVKPHAWSSAHAGARIPLILRLRPESTSTQVLLIPWMQEPTHLRFHNLFAGQWHVFGTIRPGTGASAALVGEYHVWEEFGVVYYCTTLRIPADARPGKHVVPLEIEWTPLEDGAVSALVAGVLLPSGVKRPELSWRTTCEVEFEVLDPATSLAAVLSEEERRSINAAMKSALVGTLFFPDEWLDRRHRTSSSSGSLRYLYFVPSEELVFNVFARYGSDEQHVGTCRLSPFVEQVVYGFHITHDPSILFPDATHVDLILRAVDPAGSSLGEHTARRVREIVIEGVAIRLMTQDEDEHAVGLDDEID